MLFSASSGAQQMSYQLLGIKAEPAAQAPSPANRCAALNWVSSIGACGRDLLAKIAPRLERARTDALEAAGSAVEAPLAAIGIPVARRAVDPAPRAEALGAVELPTLGTSEPRYLRSAGGREALIGSRSADLSLRIGSKHRFKSEESFTDTVYQNHVSNNGHKAVGVELLVPFQ